MDNPELRSEESEVQDILDETASSPLVDDPEFVQFDNIQPPEEASNESGNSGVSAALSPDELAPPAAAPKEIKPSLAFEIELQSCLKPEDFLAVRTFYEKFRDFQPKVGKVKEKFFDTIDFTKVVIPYAESVRLVKSEGFDELGLECKFNPKEGILVIQGTPTKGYDGELRIKVDCHIAEKLFTNDANDKNFKLKGEFRAKTYTFKPQFIINPDPWDLWQNLPSEGADYVKPDTDFGSATLCASPQITFLCASQRGRSHAQESKFRDDHFQFYFPEKDALTLVALPPEGEAASLEKEPTRTDEPGPSPDRWNFIAVADGAGSAKFSREGSRIACTKMIDSFRTDFFDKFSDKLDAAILGALPESGSIYKEIPGAEVVVGADQSGAKHTVASFCARAVWNVYEEIRTGALKYNEQASADFQNATSELNVSVQTTPKQNAEIRDYSTTLLFAAVKRFSATETRKQFWAIIAYWVGDGGLAIYRPNGRDEVLPLGKPDGGEYAGQTRFITTRDEIEPTAVANRVKIALVEDFKALVLMTDGLTDPFFPAESDLAKIEYWRKFWNETLQGKDDRLYRRAPNDPEDFLGVLDQSRAPNERAKSLLDGLMFKVKGNHDDRTIALLINDDMSDEIPPEPTPENQEVDAQMTNESAPIETPTDAGNLAAHDTATGLDATQEPSVEDATTEQREPAQTGANQTGDAQVTNDSASDATPESNAVVETPTDAENGATTETAQNNDGQTPVEVSPAASAQSPAPVSQDSAEGSEAPSSPTAEPQQS